MKQPYDIEHILKTKKPTLTVGERDVLWKQIQGRISDRKSVRSPYVTFFVDYKHVVVAGLLVALITGSTARIAEASRPGDFLFPLDRAIEETQLFLTQNDESRAVLYERIGEERLAELRSILEEEMTPFLRSDSASRENISTSSLADLYIEADIFTDTTIVKIEYNDSTSYYTTDARIRESIVTFISTLYPELTVHEIEGVLSIENENRASRAKDRGEVVVNEDTRVQQAVAEMLATLDGVSDSTREELLRALQNELENLDIEIDDDRIQLRSERSKFRFEDDDDNDEDEENEKGDESRVEYRDSETRIRIEEKDGETRIQIKAEHSDDDTRDDSDDSEERDSSGRDEREHSEDEADDDSNSDNEREDDEDDNSGKGNSDDTDDEDEDENENESEDEEDEEDEEDDNSGKGNSDDEDEEDV
jgi:hypothetical protein